MNSQSYRNRRPAMFSPLDQFNPCKQQNSRERSQPFFKPVPSTQGVGLKVAVSKPEQKPCDRLSALHSCLQQEAEKIRKWKNATEVEMKEKDKKLQSSEQVIDSQKKFVTELRIDNENLSSKLQDELSNQRELQKKIQGTLELSSALNQHVCHVENTVERGKEEREELYLLHREQDLKYKNLLEKLESLELHWTEKQGTLEENVMEEAKKNESLSSDIKSLNSEIETLLVNKSTAQENILALQRKIEESSVNQECLSQTVHSLQAEAVQLKNDISVHQLASKKFEVDCQASACKIKDLSTSVLNLKEELVEQERKHQFHMENQSVKYKSEIEEISLDFKQSLLKEETKCQNVQKEICLKMDEIECLKQDIILLNKTVHVKEENLQQLKDSTSMQSQKISSLEDTISGLKNNLRCNNDVYSQDMKKMELDMEHCREKGKGMKEIISQLEVELASNQEKVLCLQHEVEKYAKQNTDLSNQVTEMQENLRSKQKEMEDLKHAHAEEKTLLKKNFDDDLTSQRERFLEEAKIVSQSNAEEMKALKTKLQRLEDELSGVVSSYSFEFKSLKAVHTKETGNLQEMIHSLNQKIVQYEEDVSDIKEESSKKLQCVQHQYDEAKKSYDAQVDELCVMLEKYKIENLKIVSQKDKDIEALQVKFAQLEQDKMKLEEQLRSSQEKIAFEEEKSSHTPSSKVEVKLAQGSKLKPLKPQKSKASSNNKQEMAKPNELKLTREKENIKHFRPEVKGSRKLKTKAVDDLSWFDTDTVFGFGPED